MKKKCTLLVLFFLTMETPDMNPVMLVSLSQWHNCYPSASLCRITFLYEGLLLCTWENNLSVSSIALRMFLKWSHYNFYIQRTFPIGSDIHCPLAAQMGFIIIELYFKSLYNTSLSPFNILMKDCLLILYFSNDF